MNLKKTLCSSVGCISFPNEGLGLIYIYLSIYFFRIMTMTCMKALFVRCSLGPFSCKF